MKYSFRIVKYLITYLHTTVIFKINEGMALMDIFSQALFLFFFANIISRKINFSIIVETVMF